VWIPGFKWLTSCKVDLLYFPFDTQLCEVQFNNWVYGAPYVTFTSSLGHAVMGYYTPNGEWDITETKVASQQFVVDYTELGPLYGTIIDSIAFRLELKRIPGYYTLNVIAPGVLMTIMSFLLFYLPVESGEKISLGITVSLAFSVLMLMISDMTPRVGDSTPIMSEYGGIKKLECISIQKGVLHYHVHSSMLNIGSICNHNEVYFRYVFDSLTGPDWSVCSHDHSGPEHIPHKSREASA